MEEKGRTISGDSRLGVGEELGVGLEGFGMPIENAVEEFGLLLERLEPPTSIEQKRTLSIVIPSNRTRSGKGRRGMMIGRAGQGERRTNPPCRPLDRRSP
jgi:hypothetical protein